MNKTTNQEQERAAEAREITCSGSPNNDSKVEPRLNRFVSVRRYFGLIKGETDILLRDSTGIYTDTGVVICILKRYVHQCQIEPALKTS